MKLFIMHWASEKGLLFLLTLIGLGGRIASVTLYLNENEAENPQNGEVHLAQMADFASRTIWRIEVSDGSSFAFFMLFHLSLTFFSTGASL